MRHYLSGEEVHVPPREIVREDAELEKRHEDPETGALAHPLDTRQHRPGAADESSATLDEGFGGEPTAAQRSATADEILHRAHRGVAGRHQHFEALAQEI